MAKDNLDDEKNKIDAPNATWEKIGKSYRGVLVEVKEVKSNEVRIYTLAEATEKVDEKADSIPVEGGLIQIWGRRGENPKVIPELDRCSLGQDVLVKFTKQAPGKGTLSGYKEISVYTKGTMKPEVLAKFNGETTDEDTQRAEENVEKM